MAHASRRENQTDRRGFLSRLSAVAAGLLARDVTASPDVRPTALPTIALGQHRISRLIVGSNPILGYSYLGRDVDQEMKAYFTPERTQSFLKQCERAGINTHQFSAASEATDVYRALRDEGSQLQLIGLHSKREDIKRAAEAVQPIAIAHHGGVTDRLFREGRSGQVHDFVKAVHDQGLLAGVSAHNPDCIQRAADEGWDVDFFMTCFYFLTRVGPPAAEDSPVLGGPNVGYTFFRNDPQRMCAVIRQVKQPCLAFKILAAGRRCDSQKTVRSAFEFAFRHIKPTDGVIVGMYPQRLDQVGVNAEYAQQLGVVG